MLIEKKIFNDLKKTIRSKKAYLHEPYLDKSDKKNLLKCFKSTLVSSINSKNSFNRKFINELKKITKSKYVSLMVNGTSALHLSLISIGTKKDNEILMPSLNYIAAANATLYCNAKPHFIDIDKKTLTICPKNLEIYLKVNTKIKNGCCINKKTGNKIHALIVLHIFGMSALIDEICKICKRYKIKVIEDAAEALGSYFKKKHLGNFGTCGILSFNGNKVVTTGNGGALITNDKKIYKTADHLSQIAKLKKNYFDYSEIGYNYKMSNINSALGLGQLKRLKQIIKKKETLYKKYKKASNQSPHYKILDKPKDSKPNYWLITMVLNERNKMLKNKLLKVTNKNGFQTRPAWKLLHKVNYLKKFPRGSLKNCEEMYDKIINLPSSPSLM